MKRFVRVFFLLFLILTLLSFNTSGDGAVPQAVLDSVNSVVRIVSEYSDGYATGSGFVIQSDSDATLIATNHHVIEDNPRSISIWTESGIKVAVTILADDPELDLCILQLPYPNTTLKALVLDEDAVKRGEAVYAVGFPGAADDLTLSEAYTSEAATITTGIISSIRSTHAIEGGREFRLLQSTAPINHGNSGGPLFNNQGHVVGVNTYSVNDSTGIYGAVHVGELIDFAERYGIDIRLPEITKDRSPVPMIAAAAGAVLLVIACVFFVIRIRRKKKNQQNVSRSYDSNDLEPTQETDTETIGEKQEVVGKEPKKRRHIKLRTVIAAAAILSLVGVGILGYLYVSHYQRAVELADRGSFAEAEDSLFLPSLTKLHDSRLIDYLDAGKAFAKGDYEEAIKAFSELDGYKKADSYLLEAKYQKGVALLNNKDFDAAAEVFQELSELGDPNSDEMLLKIKYAHAEWQLSENNYAEAIEEFTELSVLNYADAKDRISEAKLLQAEEIMHGEKDYQSAYEMLKALGDYADDAITECILLWSADYLEKQDSLNAFRILQIESGNPKLQSEIEQMKTLLYQEAVALYRTNGEDEAFDSFIRFYAVYPYERTEDYIALLKEKYSIFDWGEKGKSDAERRLYHYFINEFIKKCEEKGIKVEGANNKREFREYWPDIVQYQFTLNPYVDSISYGYSDLLSILSFEDAAVVILDYYADSFLTGTWKTADGDYYFKLKSNGDTSYNLPWFDFGEYYQFENGDYLLCSDKDPDDTRTLFSFHIVNKDIIDVYCYKDDTWYRLIRQ